MNRERHARMKELFLAACERTAGERGPFLDQACGDDAEETTTTTTRIAVETIQAATVNSRPAVARRDLADR